MTTPPAFEAIDNFRDFGGYASAHGGHVVTGVLFRAGHQAHATPQDRAAFDALNLGVIVDLRRATERANHLTDRSGFTGVLIQNDLGDRQESPHVAFLKSTDMSEASIDAYLTDYYGNAAFDARLVDLFSRFFVALAETDRPILIHCTAGKDRTGILVALTHQLLGVSWVDIEADFLITNRIRRTEARIAAAEPQLEKMIGRPATPAAVRTFLGVDGKYLKLTFDSIAARHGEIENYLGDLGVTPAQTSALRARLIR